jgi:hypothetical protein
MDDKCAVIEYEDLTPATAAAVVAYFGLQFSSDGERRLAEVFRLDAKNPGRVFETDAEAKEHAATETLKRCTDRWAGAPYSQLRKRATGLAAKTWETQATSALGSPR